VIIGAKIFMIVGLFFLTTAAIGFLRFPDFYTRMHATAKGDTLGTLLFVIGLVLYTLHHGLHWFGIVHSIKLLSIAVFWFLASPTATHALLRSALESDLVPWTKDGKVVLSWPPKRRK
jgi:multicomponent Na+:H+ antiporter subunit G